MATGPYPGFPIAARSTASVERSPLAESIAVRAPSENVLNASTGKRSDSSPVANATASSAVGLSLSEVRTSMARRAKSFTAVVSSLAALSDTSPERMKLDRRSAR